MKNAYAGGGDFQQTVMIEYTWIDRLIDWSKSNMVDVVIFSILVIFVIYLWKKK